MRQSSRPAPRARARRRLASSASSSLLMMLCVHGAHAAVSVNYKGCWGNSRYNPISNFPVPPFASTAFVADAQQVTPLDCAVLCGGKTDNYALMFPSTANPSMVQCGCVSDSTFINKYFGSDRVYPGLSDSECTSGAGSGDKGFYGLSCKNSASCGGIDPTGGMRYTLYQIANYNNNPNSPLDAAAVAASNAQQGNANGAVQGQGQGQTSGGQNVGGQNGGGQSGGGVIKAPPAATTTGASQVQPPVDAAAMPQGQAPPQDLSTSVIPPPMSQQQKDVGAASAASSTLPMAAAPPMITPPASSSSGASDPLLGGQKNAVPAHPETAVKTSGGPLSSAAPVSHVDDQNANSVSSSQSSPNQQFIVGMVFFAFGTFLTIVLTLLYIIRRRMARGQPAIPNRISRFFSLPESMKSRGWKIRRDTGEFSDGGPFRGGKGKVNKLFFFGAGSRRGAFGGFMPFSDDADVYDVSAGHALVESGVYGHDDESAIDGGNRRRGSSQSADFKNPGRASSVVVDTSRGESTAVERFHDGVLSATSPPPPSGLSSASVTSPSRALLSSVNGVSDHDRLSTTGTSNKTSGSQPVKLKSILSNRNSRRAEMMASAASRAVTQGIPSRSSSILSFYDDTSSMKKLSVIMVGVNSDKSRPSSAAAALENPTNGGKEPNVGDICECVYDFEPQLADEIPLRVGDSVKILVKFQDGWAKGTNLKLDVTGAFPMFSVASLDDADVDAAAL